MTRLAMDLTLGRGTFGLQAQHTGDLAGVTALFGASGAGKSTLLRGIAGLEPSMSGALKFGETVWQSDAINLPAHKRGVGLVFQDAQLFGHLSVAGNLRYAARRAHGQAIAEDKVVQAFDLGPLMARRPNGLSGGERQRVAMARAVIGRPQLLLMDEPLAGLDMKRKSAILPYIAALPDQFGMPVIYVTHAIDEVTRIANDMLVIQDGKLVDNGPVADVFARMDLAGAGSRFEAGVILTAKVAAHDAAYHLTKLQLGTQTLWMPEADLPIGTAVSLRIRARDVMVATHKPEGISAQNILQAQITDIRPEPDRAFAELFLSVGAQTLRARLTRKAVDDLALSKGKPVFAVLKAISFDRRGFIGE